MPTSCSRRRVRKSATSGNIEGRPRRTASSAAKATISTKSVYPRDPPRPFASPSSTRSRSSSFRATRSDRTTSKKCSIAFATPTSRWATPPPTERASFPAFRRSPSDRRGGGPPPPRGPQDADAALPSPAPLGGGGGPFPRGLPPRPGGGTRGLRPPPGPRRAGGPPPRRSRGLFSGPSGEARSIGGGVAHRLVGVAKAIEHFLLVV